MNNNMFNVLSQVLGMSKDPNIIINNLIGQNPQLQAVMNMMNGSGMSPKQFAEKYARQNGMDITGIVSAMRQFGMKI